MSIHDETWDKCPKCKQTIKTWHGDFHNSGGCLDYVSFHNWERERMENMNYFRESADLLDAGIPNHLIGMLKSLEKVDPPKTKPATSYFDKDFQ
jgi:hypothetical protein